MALADPKSVTSATCSRIMAAWVLSAASKGLVRARLIGSAWPDFKEHEVCRREYSAARPPRGDPVRAVNLKSLDRAAFGDGVRQPDQAKTLPLSVDIST
ncbi:MAG: hypothetical protein R3D85_10500 [Paracoccaceae bacterium]